MSPYRVAVARFSACLGSACIFSAFFISWSSAAEPVIEQDTTADELVATALKFELDGDNRYRDLTLQAAAKANPEFKPAKWQLGFVEVDGKWVHSEQVGDLRSSNSTLREYQSIRPTALGEADGELALARWCRRNKLPDVAQVHLNRVLRNEMSSTAQRNLAAQLLDLRAYGNQMVTADELTNIQREERAAEQVFKTWVKRIEDWHKRSRAVAADDEKRRSANCERLKRSKPSRPWNHYFPPFRPRTH